MEETKLFDPVISEDEGLSFGVALKILPKEGNLVYEYNPFRNYRLSEDRYEYKGKYLTFDGLLLQLKEEHDISDKVLIIYEKQELINDDGNKQLDENQNQLYKYQLLNQKKDEKYIDITENDISINNWTLLFCDENGETPLFLTLETPELHEAGELVDFQTDELNFDINHPVDLLPQYSYDDSVNLIINDGKNKPKLINSRFSAIGRNRYLVVDRKGNLDTNIYDLGNLFNSDTSLYKQISKIPKLLFLGTTFGGNLPVGNYHFYFRYADADGNESDFVIESGLVSIFIGENPVNARMGFREENSYKIVKFLLTNVDEAYPYVKIYYTKATSDIYLNMVVSAYEILLKFEIKSNGIAEITITGFEDKLEVSIDEINPYYQLCNSVNTLAICLNMLFLGNVEKPKIDLEDLSDISLYFLPYLNKKPYDIEIDKNYQIKNLELGYTDPTYIYNYTGYWDLEIYRLGIVYILEDNSLSLVFNIRGVEDVLENMSDNYYLLNTNASLDKKTREKFSYDEDGFIKNDLHNIRKFENAKGVISLKESDFNDNDNVLSIGITVDRKVITYLQEEYGIKGFFFVRLKRIPTTLCQALTVGIDRESHTPVLPISNGNQIITELDLDLHTICINKKTGEVVRGDTMVPRPVNGWAIAGIVVGSLLLNSALPGVGLVAGVSAGVLYNNLKGCIRADLKYANDDDWEVYYTLKKPTDDVCYVAERFLTDEKKLEESFIKHLYFLNSSLVTNTALICPDYDVNSPYYNNIFNGGSVVLQEHTYLPPEKEYLEYDIYDERHFYNSDFKRSSSDGSYYTCKTLGIEDNVKLLAIDDIFFAARAGEAEEAFRYSYLGLKEKLTSSYNLLRGSFGPYVALTGYNKHNKIVNIKIPGYSVNNLKDYFKIRMNDFTPFYAISERIDLNNINDWFEKSKNENASNTIIDNTYDGELKLRNSLYRGDCYICQFTHRMNRNFQDPSAPTNDDIVDEKCWMKNYAVEDNVVKIENFDNINLGDVNAVPLGMWVTSRYRSSINLNVRSIDDSISDEEALFGHPRGYYPLHPISAEGSYKIPEALCHNAGISKSVSERYNIIYPDVPFSKNNFVTRILYSDIQVKDNFKNGFRVFKGNHYRDYPMTYGSITKLVEWFGNLLCIFEHGVALIAVNERAIAGEGAGGNIYINTSNVLPENPKVISDTFGSLWKDSIIKTPNGVYGVDTVGKKIWWTNGQDFKCISDFRVLEFLNKNITLTERELEPIIGVRNVKTHYNKYKGDVLFTFYDNLCGFEETSWNLCWNESLLKFITFYSWIPSYSENIYNLFFTFDRNTSKWIGKLGISNTNSDWAEGITLSNNIIYPNKEEIGILSLDKSFLPLGTGVEYKCSFELVRDNYGYYKHFDINGNILSLKDSKIYKELCTEYYVRKDTNDSDIYPDDEKYELNLQLLYDETKRRIWVPQSRQPNGGRPVILLNIRANVSASIKDGFTNIKEMEEYTDSYNDNYSTYNSGFLEYTVAVIPEYNMQFLTTDFWKHGLAGIIDLKDTIKPTHWYGKLHPFEIEFIVAPEPDKHKIFNNLEIISNNAEPESFHYEIIGNCYDFADDKKNMYIRLEATKELYQYNGSDIIFDHLYKDLVSKPRSIETGNEIDDNYNKPNFDKSTIFPLYYSRLDTMNEVEDSYHLFNDSTDKDYASLGGGEIIRYRNLDEYRLCNHVKAVDITDYLNNGRLRGNMQYKEDKWYVQINPFNLVLRNELTGEWENIYKKEGAKTKYMVPAECNLFDPPKELYDDNGNIQKINLPDDWERNITQWNINDHPTECVLQEAKLKDKWMKVRVRYSGEKLAIINAIKTLYSISYA